MQTTTTLDTSALGFFFACLTKSGAKSVLGCRPVQTTRNDLPALKQGVQETTPLGPTLLAGHDIDDVLLAGKPFMTMQQRLLLRFVRCAVKAPCAQCSIKHVGVNLTAAAPVGQRAPRYPVQHVHAELNERRSVCLHGGRQALHKQLRRSICHRIKRQGTPRNMTTEIDELQ